MLIAKPEVDHAPGCFGSALAYKEGDPICQACPFVAQCGPRSVARLSALRAQHGIPEPKTPIKRPVVTAAGVTEMTVPVKVAALIERLERAGIAIADSLRRGVNPFKERPAFLKLACHLMLRMPQGFTRAQLTAAYERRLGWTLQTAQSHTSLVVGTLIATGAARDDNGQIVLRGN